MKILIFFSPEMKSIDGNLLMHSPNESFKKDRMFDAYLFRIEHCLFISFMLKFEIMLLDKLTILFSPLSKFLQEIIQFAFFNMNFHDLWIDVSNRWA